MSRIDLSIPLGAHGPSTYTPPALDPAGVTHERVEVAPDVHALVSSRPPVDNSSFVVGEDAVLVVDSNINGEMGRRIQARVREVTDLPIRFLVNTNHFGDHSFGNYTFPKETIVVGHRETARGMRDLEQQKHFLSLCVGDPAVYGDLQLRLPDVVFDNYLRLELGGKSVELYHFGPGSTLGDTIVYEPAGRVVWTGNLVSGGWSIPLLLEGSAGEWIKTLGTLLDRLEVETVIPGHGPLTSAATFSRNIGYLSDLIHDVRAAIRAGKSLEETLTSVEFKEPWAPPADVPDAARLPNLWGTHSHNVQRTYEDQLRSRG